MLHSYRRRKLVSCLSVRCAGLENCIDRATAPASLEPDARNRTTQRQIGYKSKFAAVRPFLREILANELSQFVSTAVSRLLVTSFTLGANLHELVIYGCLVQAYSEIRARAQSAMPWKYYQRKRVVFTWL